MPKKVHEALVRGANKKGLKGERKDAYVYGTMNKIKAQQHTKVRRTGKRRG